MPARENARKHNRRERACDNKQRKSQPVMITVSQTPKGAATGQDRSSDPEEGLYANERANGHQALLNVSSWTSA